MIRLVEPEDIDAVVRLQASAFNFPVDGSKADQVRRNIEHDRGEWLVFTLDGQPVGSLHVRRDQMRMGKSILLKGDVGDVAVDSSRQGQGLGTHLLQEDHAWMRDNGFDLARLGGLFRFYSRFGYVRFFRRYVDFTVGKLASAGASKVREGQIPIEEKWANAIRPFDPELDKREFLNLREEFFKDYLASPVFSDTEVLGPGPLFWVVRDHGRLLGYLRGSERETEASEFEARIQIGEVAFRRECPEVFQALIAKAYNDAFEKNIPRMTARLPFDSTLVALLSKMPIRFHFVETYGGLAGNMMQIVNLRSLLEKMIPELEDRLRNVFPFSWKGTLEIGIEKDRVGLLIDNGTIRVQDPSNPEMRISLNEYDLLKLILGLGAFEELQESGSNLKPLPRNLLNALFPRRKTYSGLWG